MIVAGAENRPPMLDNSMYNSWQSCMLLYIKGNKNGRMMLNSIKNGPLVYPTIEEDGKLREKKYAKLTEQEKLQDDCDAAKDIWDRVKLLMQGTKLSYQERECKLYNEFDKFTLVKGESLYEYYLRFAQLINDKHIIGMTMQQVQTQLNHTPPTVPQHAYRTPLISQQPQAEFPQLDSRLAVPSFLPGNDPIACLNKAISFLSTVVASRFPSTNNQLRTSFNLRNQATIQDGRAEGHMARQCTQPKRPRNSAWFKEKMLLVQPHESGQVLDEEQLAVLADPRIPDGQAIQTTIPQNAAFQTDDLDAYDSDYDDISSAKAVLMANLSSYGLDVLSKVPHSDIYQNDMANQSVQEM
ncbi:hypothetical protein Tco_0661478 [Tanacetum coccineum]